MKRVVLWLLDRPRRAYVAAGLSAAFGVGVGGHAVLSTHNALPVNEDQACVEDVTRFARHLFVAERGDKWQRELVAMSDHDRLDFDPSLVPNGPASITAVHRDNDICTATVRAADGFDWSVRMQWRDKGDWRGDAWAPTGEG